MTATTALLLSLALAASASSKSKAASHERAKSAEPARAAEEAPACAEEEIPFRVPATGPQLDQALELLAAMDVSGRKVTTSQGVTFTLRKIRDLRWRSGVEGLADVDFDHSSVTGSGTLPFRIEVELDSAAQVLKPHLRLTGPIRVERSTAKAAAGPFAGLLQNNLGSIVGPVSESEAFRDEFSRQAEANMKRPSITELVRALKSYLPLPADVCLGAGKLDELKLHLDGLTVGGSVRIRRGSHCCG